MQKINTPIELSDAELATIQGGGLFGWIEKHVFKPVMAVLRGGNPPPNLDIDPRNPFGKDLSLNPPDWQR